MKNKSRNFVCFLLALLAVLACNNNKKATDAQQMISPIFEAEQFPISLESNNFPKIGLDSIPCDSVLYMLVQSSDLDSSLKNIPVMQNGINNDTVLVELYHENEVEPGAFAIGAESWLNLVVTNRTLYKCSINDDTLSELKCNTKIMNFYINHCLKIK